MSRYGLKEVHRTIWGNGAFAGQTMVVVRFSDCNLWDGNPLHREEGAASCALWCDTDFQSGVVLDTDDVLSMMQEQWPLKPGSSPRWCMLTGGEPALQLDTDLIVALNKAGWLVAIETNGTVKNTHLDACDHVCVSPKLGTPWMECGAKPDSVLVVLPGAAPLAVGWSDEELEQLEAYWAEAAPQFYVQPQDPVLPGNDMASLLRGGYEEDEGEMLEQVWVRAVRQCMRHVYRNPHWRMSLQTEKWVGLT